MAEEQPPKVKAEARQFMADLMAAPEPSDFAGGNGVNMTAWKSIYNAAATTKDSTLMDHFWSIYNPSSTSIWTVRYDEPEYNENLEDTIKMVKDFMKKTTSLKDHCFGVMHTLASLEIEGLWVFNGPDPEKLFGANEDTSWYSFSQMGPEANELVRKSVGSILAPTGSQLDGKTIKDTQTF